MADWFDGTRIKLLTAADFENDKPWVSRSKRCATILFFADWCGHCKNFKPEYIKFADVAQFMRVYAVDTVSMKNFMEKLDRKDSPIQIKGYPTVWLYRKGMPAEEYTGNMDAQSLLSKACSLCDESCKCDKTKRKICRKIKK